MSVKVIADTEEARYIAALVERSKAAQRIAATFTQEKVDELCSAIVWEIIRNPSIVEDLAIRSMEEIRLGDVPSKISKLSSKIRGLLYDLKPMKSVGIVEEIPEKGLQKIAKPVGVIGSLVPSTQPEMIPIMQAMNAVKARDSIIFSPHPRGKKTTVYTIDLVRAVMKKYGAPEDLFITIPEPSLAKTNELMRQCDLVIATGGAPMVKAAYSSGTPAYGVGAGNAQIVVDASNDIPDAVAKIKASKTFDLAAGCSCDNALIVHADIYDAFLQACDAAGIYLIPPEKKEATQKAIWPNYPADHVINRDIVAKPADFIANLIGLDVPDGTCMFLIEENQVGAATPFAGEKMCLVTTLYRFHTIEEAIDITVKNQAYSGAGHSCGIYSKDVANIEKYALETFTTRVVVNQPQAATNTGSWTSGMPFTSSLGCGTWGGNIASENISLKHFLNNTWVIREIPNFQVGDDVLFQGFKAR